jgi:serine/threonine protein kinase
VQSIVEQAIESIAEHLDLPSAGWTHVPCGSGGQTASYRAACKTSVICVKTAAPGSPHLRREAMMLARLCGPHFPRLLLDGTNRGFIVEEFVPGTSLSALDPHARLAALPAIVSGLTAATEALTEQHRPILHRDLKPVNLRMSGSNLVVLDFGSAEFEGSRPQRFIHARRTKLGCGTHHAQPLEQLLGSPLQDRRVDVFSAAAVLFWVMTGRSPYLNLQADRAEAWQAYLATESGLREALPQWPNVVRDALVDALRVDPEHRSVTLRPLAYALLRHLGEPTCFA